MLKVKTECLAIRPRVWLIATAFCTSMLMSAPAKAEADCGGAAAPGLDWTKCDKSNILLQGSNLEKANLSEADFSSTDLSGANLTTANFEKAKLIRTLFAGVDARGAKFARVEAYRSGFMKANLEQASFVSAELERADFSNAQLTGANFEKAELGRATFQHAVLTGARFAFADLARADFRNITFTGPLVFDHAFMFLTHIEGIDLSASTGLTQDQIDFTCGDSSTKLPGGLKTPSSWPCNFD